MNILNRNNDIGILILRLTIGILMLLHGIAKVVNGVGFIEGILLAKGLPAFFTYGVYVGEVVAPIAIIIGFRSRFASAIYLINCIVAILLVHVNDIFTIGKHGGWGIELLGLYAFGSLALLFTGAGKYSVSSRNILD